MAGYTTISNPWIDLAVYGATFVAILALAVALTWGDQR